MPEPRGSAGVAASIIVPVYNGEATIRECLDSLLMQQYDGEFEIVVVDNASTDGTAAILQSFGSRLRTFSESRRGAAAARNRGLREARGEVIAFTDADCVAEPGWLSALTEPLGDPSVGAVGGTILSRRTGNRIERFGETIHDHQAAIEQELPYVITMNWASRRHVLFEAGLFDEALLRGQDVDLGWRILHAGYRLVYAPRATIRHRNERSIWGLMHEGYVHGFHGARVRRKHAGLASPGVTLRSSARRRLFRHLRHVFLGGDRVDAALAFLFDLGKVGGELVAVVRPPHHRGAAAAVTHAEHRSR